MAETVEVPFVVFGNKRALTDEQLAEDPELAAFVKRFSSAFDRHEDECIWVFIEPA